ncbi:hypothetical protein FQN57_003193 [Myotisia sp. PD_48]|nr:hypothetical protein FQN57_003193 [Myotisia sp. PD_48]
MAELVDPATGQPLPPDSIQRVLYLCKSVHVYAIPPLMSMKGYKAADWTIPDAQNNGQTKEIFTGRLRVLETAYSITPDPPRPVPGVRSPPPTPSATEPQEHVKTDILLEDAETGSLFAAAPYTDSNVVEHVIDSSRFFALRVFGDGKKAVLGIGFEDRSDAFDFGVALQEARKILSFSTPTDSSATSTSTSFSSSSSPSGAVEGNTRNYTPTAGGRSYSPGAAAGRAPPARPGASGMRPFPQNSTGIRGVGGGGGGRGGVPGRPLPGASGGGHPHRSQVGAQPPDNPTPVLQPKDYSLKPGETISLKFGSSRPRGGGADTTGSRDDSKGDEEASKNALFSILPPPPKPASSFDSGPATNSAIPFLPPPPDARGSRAAGDDRRRRPAPSGAETDENDTVPFSTSNDGFDDDFGEFQ